MSCLQLSIRPTPNGTRECNEHAEGFRVVFGAVACLEALDDADHDCEDNDLAGRANCERHVRDPVSREGLEIRVVIETVQDKNKGYEEREDMHKKTTDVFFLCFASSADCSTSGRWRASPGNAAVQNVRAH